MSNLVEHAKRELELLKLFSEEGDFYGGSTAKAVMELIEVFAKQGHSGSSAPMVISLFKELANFNTISPITGESSEWNKVGDDLWQNMRNSAIFKDNEKSWYIDGIVKRTPNGGTYSGGFYESKESFENGGERKSSKRCYIKQFPFIPKTFYVDVDEAEVEKDSWEMWAINPEQLEEVKQYYNI